MQQSKKDEWKINDKINAKKVLPIDIPIKKNDDYKVILCNDEEILQKVKIDTDVMINIASPKRSSPIVHGTACVNKVRIHCKLIYLVCTI